MELPQSLGQSSFLSADQVYRSPHIHNWVSRNIEANDTGNGVEDDSLLVSERFVVELIQPDPPSSTTLRDSGQRTVALSLVSPTSAT